MPHPSSVSPVSLLLLLPDGKGVIRKLTGRISFFLLEGLTLPVIFPDRVGVSFKSRGRGDMNRF